jgi:hypothetical protein
MRHRRRHHDDRTSPSGRAEVELFAAWEREFTVDAAAPPEPEPSGDPISTAPLWWALSVATVFLLVALLL